MNYPARNSDPSTSHESAQIVSGNLAAKLRGRIISLAQSAGREGITISEAAQQIPEHKNTSVSPRFSELVESKGLVRVLMGHGKPTKKSPGGVPRYATRFDTQTKRNVTIHWLPEFTPTLQEAQSFTVKAAKRKPPQSVTHAVKAHRKVK